MGRQRKQETKDSHRSRQNDPSHKNEHRLRYRLKESDQRRPRTFGAARDGESEKKCEENQRHHRAGSRRSDRIWRKQRRKPRSKGLGLGAGGDLARRLGGACRQRRRSGAMLRNKAEERPHER